MLGRSDTAPSEAFDFLDAFSDYERLREDAYRLLADRHDWLGRVVSSEPPVRRE